MIVDVHTHFWPISIEGLEGVREAKFVSNGASSGKGSWSIDYGGGFTIGLSDVDMTVRTDIEARIRSMEGRGIDYEILSPSPTIYMYWADENIGRRVCASCNDGMGRLTRGHSDRVKGNAILPLQDVRASIIELDRAISDLELSGVMIGSNINERNLDDEVFTPFFEKAQDLDIPIFVHSPPLIRSERLQKYDLFWAFGYLVDESIAVASLIFGGILEEFPNLKVYVPHGGGLIPYHLGRMQKLSEVRQNARVKMRKTFMDSFRKIYFDVTLADVGALELLVATVGAERILYGTNYPAWGEGVDYMANVRSLEIPEEDKRKILGENAVRLFGIG